MRIVAFWDKLNNLNLQAVEHKLMSSKEWTAEKTQVAINRYKLFLYLKSVYPAAVLVPTQEIDAVWHAHFEVNLRQYIEDCNYLFGYLLNHCSADGGEQNEQTLQIYEEAFSLTKALFEEFFGVEILDNTSINMASCADIPIDTNPAPCTVLPIINKF